VGGNERGAGVSERKQGQAYSKENNNGAKRETGKEKFGQSDKSGIISPKKLGFTDLLQEKLILAKEYENDRQGLQDLLAPYWVKFGDAYKNNSNPQKAILEELLADIYGGNVMLQTFGASEHLQELLHLFGT